MGREVESGSWKGWEKDEYDKKILYKFSNNYILKIKIIKELSFFLTAYKFWLEPQAWQQALLLSHLMSPHLSILEVNISKFFSY